MKCKCYI